MRLIRSICQQIRDVLVDLSDAAWTWWARVQYRRGKTLPWGDVKQRYNTRLEE